MKVTVLGTGTWGTALAQLLCDNDNEVIMYGIEKSEVEADIISDIISVKNPTSGYITVLDIKEIILEEPSTCIITKTTK